MTPDFCLQRNPPICLETPAPAPELEQAPEPVTVSVVTPIPAELTTTTSEAVAAPVVLEQLPVTGFDPTALLMLGGALIAAGAATLRKFRQ